MMALRGGGSSTAASAETSTSTGTMVSGFGSERRLQKGWCPLSSVPFPPLPGPPPPPPVLPLLFHFLFLCVCALFFSISLLCAHNAPLPFFKLPLISGRQVVLPAISAAPCMHRCCCLAYPISLRSSLVSPVLLTRSTPMVV